MFDEERRLVLKSSLTLHSSLRVCAFSFFEDESNRDPVSVPTKNEAVNFSEWPFFRQFDCCYHRTINVGIGLKGGVNPTAFLNVFKRF